MVTDDDGAAGSWSPVPVCKEPCRDVWPSAALLVPVVLLAACGWSSVPPGDGLTVLPAVLSMPDVPPLPEMLPLPEMPPLPAVPAGESGPRKSMSAPPLLLPCAWTAGAHHTAPAKII